MVPLSRTIILCATWSTRYFECVAKTIGMVNCNKMSITASDEGLSKLASGSSSSNTEGFFASTDANADASSARLKVIGDDERQHQQG